MSLKKHSGAKQVAYPAHAHFCFAVLDAHFMQKPAPEPTFPHASDHFAVFVTWDIVEAGERRLRGCIGTFTPGPLGMVLEEYAVISAVRDHRFSPIKRSILPTLSCSISLLTPFEPCADPLDWEIGTHGIYITFADPSSSSSKRLTATYLPHIAPEQGWSKHQTLASAIHKAGYRGQLASIWSEDGSGGGNLKVQRYRSEKAGCTYDEWQATLREAVDADDAPSGSE